MTIRNDATRTRILVKEKRRARAVVARQGQVLLDTDLDQQSRHHLERLEIETVDTLGSPGRLLVPAGNTGFLVNVNIQGGRGYLDGWLLENADNCNLATQPHPRTGDTLAPPYVVAVKALVRHIDPVEEPKLADPALGDAQASGRALIDWQVFPFGITGGTVSCATIASNAQWQKLVAASTGKLAVLEQAPTASTDPCSLTPQGGYSRLENLNYRFEVHDGVVDSAYPTIDSPRFNLAGLKIKFSRRNASLMVRITKITNTEIEVDPPALDPRNWFAPDKYAEVVSVHDDVDPRAALAHERMFRVASADDARVTLQATAADIANTGAPAGLAVGAPWFLRLWDAFPDDAGLAIVSAPGNAATSAEIDVGDGLKLKFSIGTFRRGDYWNLAARADGTTDWPKTGGVGDPMPPHGPEVRYAPLAAFTSSVPEDCRIPFATLSDRRLLYRGGDGQAIFAPAAPTMVALPAKARVQVMRGETSVNGATVEWSFVGPTGSSCQIDGALCDATHKVQKTTPTDGISAVTWSIDGSKQLELHQVKATLVPAPSGTSQQAVVFSAAFETAAHTGYQPGQCAHLQGVDNVQKALDVLCSKIDEEPGIHVLGLELGTHKPLQNDAEYQAADLAAGIGVKLTSKVVSPLMHPPAFDPMTVVVSLELPYPANEADLKLWGGTTAKNPGLVGFTGIALRGEVKSSDNAIVWRPVGEAPDWLVTRMFQGLWAAGVRESRVLVRLTMHGNFIWDDGGQYLDGETFGAKGTAGLIDLRTLPNGTLSGDGRRGGDFRMWFWLKRVIKNVKIAPSVLSPGQSFEVIVTLSEAAPAGGLKLQLDAQPANTVSFAKAGALVVPAGSSRAVATGKVIKTRRTTGPRTIRVSAEGDVETVELAHG